MTLAPFCILLATFVVALGAGDVGKEMLTVDGRPFTINQKDFKPAKFTLYGHEFDDTYGFVSADFLPLDNRGYAEVLSYHSAVQDSIYCAITACFFCVLTNRWWSSAIWKRTLCRCTSTVNTAP